MIDNKETVNIVSGKTKLTSRCTGPPAWLFSKSTIKIPQKNYKMYKTIQKNVYLTSFKIVLDFFFLFLPFSLIAKKQVMFPMSSITKKVSKESTTFLKTVITVRNYPVPDFIYWSIILYVRKSVAGGYLPNTHFLFVRNPESIHCCIAF